MVFTHISYYSGNQVLNDIIVHCKSYQESNLTIKELNAPEWMSKDGEIFYGVWGSVLNRFQRMRTNECYPIMHCWRKSLYLDEDERFMDDKKPGPSSASGTNSKPGTPVPVVKKKENRFFYITSNIDGEVEKVGFNKSEVYETRGNIVNWQCSIPCQKNYWRIEDDFRFEVTDTGRAPPIKYVESGNSGRDKKKKEQTQTTTNNTALSDTTYSENDIGDEEDFNFYDPHGRFHHDKVRGMYNDYATPRTTQNSRYVTTPRTGRSVAKKSERFQTLNIAEKRAMNFRYFVPDTADQLKNPENYYRPGTRQTLNSIHSTNGVLQLLKNVQSLSSTRGNAKAAYVLRHDNFERGTESFQHHTELHNLALNGLIDSRDEGVMEVLVVDPLIHHTQFYTTSTGMSEELIVLQKEKEEYMKKLKSQNPSKEELLDDVLVPGSDNCFTISLQIKNDENIAVVKYFYENIKPKIRKKRDRDGLHVDTVIINVQEEASSENSTLQNGEDVHYMPSKGYISLLVEPERLKNKSNITSRELNNKDDKPWQLCGEYMVDIVNTVGQTTPDTQKQQEITHMHQLSAKLVDFIMYSRDTFHKLRMRAIQHEKDNKIEIVSLFIDMPISSFKRASAPPQDQTQQQQSSITRPLSSRGIPNTSEKESIESAIKQRETKTPVMNRQFCEHCRGLARPHVKMQEDKAFLPSSSKLFKQWCMEVKKNMSQNPEKKLTIVEFGAEPSLRNQSDLLLKQTAMYGASLVRVNPLVSKAKKGAKDTSMAPKGLQSEEAFQLIEDESCISAIQKIDHALRNICEKFKFPFEDLK
jgi:hypothetical protein